VAEFFHSCLKNAVALFHIIEKEIEWRQARGQLEGFQTMKAFKPIISVGPEHPLEEEELKFDNFRRFSTRVLEMILIQHIDGVDGLGGVHTSVRWPC
jgi:hypothetical protein